MHQALHGLLQVSDTAFPTGSFSHSLGLEALHEAGELADAADLADAVGLSLESQATSDCVALRATYGEESPGGLAYIDRLLSATKLAREARSASLATGRRFLASVRALGVESPRLAALGVATREDGPNLAVAHGAAAPALGVEVEEALYAYLYSGAASLVSAGQKLVPLGGSDAQRVLYGLREETERAAARSAGLGVETLYAFAPELDVRSMQHERQRVRLYMS